MWENSYPLIFYQVFLLNDWTTFPIYWGLMLFAVDILAFAGMSFIVFGIFKKLNLSNMQMLLIAFALSIVGSLMRMTVFEYNYINLLLGYDWYRCSVHNISVFKLVHFPGGGVCLGTVLHKGI